MQKSKNLFLSFVFLVPLLITACGSDDKGATPPTPLTNFNDLLQAGDRREFVGRSVDLDNVPVDQVVGTYVFWAGSARSGIPVFRKDRLEGRATEHVRTGNTVRISGTVRLVEAVSATDPLWERVTPEEKQDILNAKVYIVAETVQIIH